MGTVASLANARPLDYNSRLIVDSVSIESLRLVVRNIDIHFLAKESYKLCC